MRLPTTWLPPGKYIMCMGRKSHSNNNTALNSLSTLSPCNSTDCLQLTCTQPTPAHTLTHAHLHKLTQLRRAENCPQLNKLVDIPNGIDLPTIHLHTGFTQLHPAENCHQVNEIADFPNGTDLPTIHLHIRLTQLHALKPPASNHL